ncbi:enoyl-CoA hydratase/isomerase family protein [Alkalicoccus chagannorensis]|uniref:enoyl-CoA hydratase/isomerase family protein n=1 Tax=Alkalicoccus chagannorensis TaxID=427072 RepID=UPI00041C43D2|nr:enoyl-CoA hydratase/isomerase family protein [Alkalicoccus chagannorensis]
MPVLERDRVNSVEYWMLNRPHVKNAVNIELMKELQEALMDVERHPPQQLLVYGAGNTFCSGGDVKAFRGLQTSREALGMLLPMNRVLQQIRALDFPVTAYIEGTAAGGGAELAVCCDYIAAHPDAALGFIQGSIGLTTGWGGETCLLSKVDAEAAEQALASAALYPADVWNRSGLIDTWARSPEEAARNVESLIQCRSGRRLPAPSDEVFSRMEQEAYRCAERWASKEHHDAVASFIERRREER